MTCNQATNDLKSQVHKLSAIETVSRRAAQTMHAVIDFSQAKLKFNNTALKVDVKCASSSSSSSGVEA